MNTDGSGIEITMIQISKVSFDQDLRNFGYILLSLKDIVQANLSIDQYIRVGLCTPPGCDLEERLLGSNNNPSNRCIAGTEHVVYLRVRSLPVDFSGEPEGYIKAIVPRWVGKFFPDVNRATARALERKLHLGSCYTTSVILHKSCHGYWFPTTEGLLLSTGDLRFPDRWEEIVKFTLDGYPVRVVTL